MVRFLILGGGGREHAIAWKLGHSCGMENIFLYPGNPGIFQNGFSCLTEKTEKKLSKEEIEQKAQDKNISCIVIGPEIYLAEGFADFFREKGFLVFGPSRFAAQLETSKIFAKKFLEQAKIPTANYQVFHSKTELEEAIQQKNFSWPLVAKYDGLAAGKGVVIAKEEKDLQEFAVRVWDKKEFSSPSHLEKILIEEYIAGKELSYMGFCDGEIFLPLATATDYKRIFNDDKGANTGGMGAISPSPYFSSELEEKIQTRIVKPILQEFAKAKWDYRGILYVGLMIDALKQDPYVLEFNVRFGDPETQAVLLRMESDFANLILATASKKLKTAEKIVFSSTVSLYAVAAAEGYPENPVVGDAIEGIGQVESFCQVFFSGVKEQGEGLQTAGGRVLGVGSVGTSLQEVRKRVYQNLEKIHWRGMHYRSDLGL